jgi:hypothetical protein
MEEERVSPKERLSGMERAAILEALKAAGWVKARAAGEPRMTQLIIGYKMTIGYKIRKHGIGNEGGTREIDEGLEDTRGETSAHYHKGGRRPQ